MSGTKKLSTAVLFGLSTVLVLAAIASFGIALLAKLTNISDSSLVVIIFILAIISMLASGFVSGMKAKMKGWLAGGATGIFFSLFVFLINYLGYSQGLSKESMVYHLGLIAASTIGGIFGVNTANKN
ncbi:TIGR04086 family membrane protein [Ectobacillus antri]|jgi:putative membrane protein (TIGR04086 family)|uniref:TIGR04086 family membrane protein n=1 Tax=Ectobacillus antri TaxID=2486280 RepID=A0ABT6H3G8_9BACI|nr:TIGR04086 family membrane protein [Ectobacillus antri]MDG4655397.1 TIGR04086 family membrane protein [Ectobacillus antri]MDG5753155.1 TIGR04086 family membrane protein [Ectobacillus antri]